MGNGMTDQALFRISFGIASFIFEAVLLLLLLVLGHRQRDNNLKFRTMVLLTLCGTVISVMDNIFRVSKAFVTPSAFQVFLQLAAIVMNVFLTYYVLKYLETFVKNSRKKNWMGHLNLLIAVAGALYALWLFFSAILQLRAGAKTVDIPTIGRIIIGYGVELYFLISAIILIAHYRRSFEKRTLFTAVLAYSVIVLAVILQLIQKRGVLLTYFGATLGSYIFYIGVEIPDHKNLQKSMHVVRVLAEAIDAKDTYTKGHSSRVAEYAREIARRAHYSEAAQEEIYMMGLLHDVGKIGVSDAVITKPGRLTDEEFEQIKGHPVKGSKILQSIDELPKLAVGAKWHHERYDGKGYPDGLAAQSIPEEARIIAVADAYDAMTSNRSYRRSMDQATVREQIEKGKGTQFDPVFADILLQMMDEDREYLLRDHETDECRKGQPGD